MILSVVLIAWAMADACGRLPEIRGRSTKRPPCAGGVADVLDVLALGVRHGLDLRDTLALASRHRDGDIGRSLAEIVHLLDRGASADDAVARCQTEPGAALSIVLAAMASSATTGVGLVAELDRVRVDVLRFDTDNTAAAARAMSVWQTAPLVLCHLPAFVLVGVAPTLMPIFGIGV